MVLPFSHLFRAPQTDPAKERGDTGSEAVVVPLPHITSSACSPLGALPWSDASDADILRRLSERRALPVPELGTGTDELLQRLVAECTREEGPQRPTFGAIVQQLGVSEGGGEDVG